MKFFASRGLLFMWLAVVACEAAAYAGDRYDAAVAHSGRSAADLKRDALDHPADMLRLAGIAPGMKVADVLAGDGYYSELASYLAGETGQVLLINNAAFDKWSEDDLGPRIAGQRLPNVMHETVDLNDMKLAPASVDAVFLVKVYHDLYWLDPKGVWPKVDVGSVLTQLHAALKPGGVLLLVDHSANAGRGKADAGALHRIDEAFAVRDFESHGFKVAGRSALLRRPQDARDRISYKGPMLGKTDRFVILFKRT